MNSYSVRVQVVVWYEVIVKARSPDDVIACAEGLKPTHIQSAGKPVQAETGLADPDSVKPIGAS
jgi:hypothetical protein